MKNKINFRQLKLLGRPVSVSVVSADTFDNAVGDCLARYQRIRISTDIPLDSTKQVLIHEVMHFYDDTLGLGLKHSQCDSIAVVFLDMIQNNPQLVKYIQSTKNEM